MKPDRPAERMMAVNAMAGLTPTERSVLVAIAYHDGPGGAHPTAATLGRECGGLAGRTVRGHIAKMVERGVLTKDKGRRGDHYSINYEWHLDRPTTGQSENLRRGAQTGRKSDVRPADGRPVNRNQPEKRKRASRQEKEAAARSAIKPPALVSEEATRRQVERAWSKAADAAGGWDVFSALPSARQEAAVMERLHKDADRQLALRLFVVMQGGAAGEDVGAATSELEGTCEGVPLGTRCPGGRSLDRIGHLRVHDRC